jgi:hypothetical protein
MHKTYLSHLSYVFRCHIHHHQEELLCHLLTTIYCYEAINCGFSSSYVVNYEGTTVHALELQYTHNS